MTSLEHSVQLPSGVTTGLIGSFKINGSANSAVSATNEQGKARWQSNEFSIEVKGRHDYSKSKTGWHIFVYGESQQTRQLIAESLDSVSLSTKSNDVISNLSLDLKRKLCLGMLPSAVIVALHPNTGTVCLIRDGAGFTPLYYTKNQDMLYFSTNLSSVLRYSTTKGINTDVISKMLVFSHGSTSRTIWQQIKVVAPGQLVQLDPGRVDRREWFWSPDACFDPDERLRLSNLSLQDALKEVRMALDESLAPLEGLSEIEVPCGGGVDSSLLGAYLAKRGQKVKFWCINQPDASRSEEEWMRPLSKQLNIPVEYANLRKENFLRNLLDQLSKTCQPLTGPNEIGGVLARTLALTEGCQNFTSGELCDTVFGGLGPFGRLRAPVRALRLLSHLPYKMRVHLHRGVISEQAWLLDSTLVEPMDEQALIGHGNLESSEKILEALQLPTRSVSRQSNQQIIADSFTWIQIRDVASGLNPLFFENDELLGGTTYYPFAGSKILNLGLHLPYSFKVNKGYKKWLWRKFASEYIGEEVAFRKKYSFPTLTSQWLVKGELLLESGFLQDLMSCDVGKIYRALPATHTSRWTLLNLELWGRLHLWNETPDDLLGRLI